MGRTLLVNKKQKQLFVCGSIRPGSWQVSGWVPEAHLKSDVFWAMRERLQWMWDMDNKPRSQRAENWIVGGSRLKNICTWGGSFIWGYGLIVCHCWAQIGASKGTEIYEQNRPFVRLRFRPLRVLCPVAFSPFPFGPFSFSLIFMSWRLINSQYCSGFCHTLTWISHLALWITASK